MKAKQEMKM